MALVMQNNRMQFKDLVMDQIKGIAMRMSPAPTIANLFVAIYKAKKIIPLIGTYLLLLRWFINNNIDIWIHNPDPTIDATNWQTIQVIANAMGLS